MAYELHGLLAGNVSIVTGENIKPSYGGDDEAFLRKVITPLYWVIEKVITQILKLQIILFQPNPSATYHFISRMTIFLLIFQEAKKSENGKAPHSAWCNYDDLNEYFWLA